MRKVFTILMFIAALSLSHFNASAQSTPAGTQSFYLTASGLTFESYTALHDKVKSDGRFELSSACIPAHVVCIKVKAQTLQSNTVDANAAIFKNMIGSISLGNIATPLNYTEQMFMDACRAERTGN